VPLGCHGGIRSRASCQRPGSQSSSVRPFTAARTATPRRSPSISSPRGRGVGPLRDGSETALLRGDLGHAPAEVERGLRDALSLGVAVDPVALLQLDRGRVHDVLERVAEIDQAPWRTGRHGAVPSEGIGGGNGRTPSAMPSLLRDVSPLPRDRAPIGGPWAGHAASAARPAHPGRGARTPPPGPPGACAREIFLSVSVTIASASVTE